MTVLERISYLIVHLRHPEELGRIVNEYREMFRRDGGILREEDGTVFSAAVYGFLVIRCYWRLRGSFDHDRALEAAYEISCRIWEAALSEKHFKRWVLRDGGSPGEAYLSRCARNRTYTAMSKAYRFLRAHGAPVQVEDAGADSDDPDPSSRQVSNTLGTVEEELVAIAKLKIYKTEFDADEKYRLQPSTRLEDIAEREQVSPSTACRRRQAARVKFLRLIGR